MLMPGYLKKAHNNIVVAEMLVTEGLFNSSAHPAYYSAFLSLKFVLAHFCSIDYKRQDVMSRGKDSHKILSEKALPFMVEYDSVTRNDYLVWYNKLNKMRKSADYKPDDIKNELLVENLNIAKLFMQHVDSYFKIA